MMQVFKYQRLTMLWSAFILIMCNINMGSVGESHLFFPGFDKLVHCGFFFMFVVLLISGHTRQNRSVSVPFIWTAAFSGLFFGALIEILQLYIFTWRTGSWDDLFADAVGIGMATFCILVTNSAIKYGKA